MKNLAFEVEELKKELSKFKPSRELAILNTKFEDLIIYLEVYRPKLEVKE